MLTNAAYGVQLFQRGRQHLAVTAPQGCALALRARQSKGPVRRRSRGHADQPAQGRSSNLRRELVRARARSWRDVQGHLALSGNADGFLIDPTERSRSRSGQCRWSGLGHSILLTCSIVACSNHGNSLYGRCSSSSPSKIHSPCFDTLVTSAEEVLVPGIGNLHHVRTYDALRFPDLLHG
jgi:hypothetical protein